jgi:hypothetical protein
MRTFMVIVMLSAVVIFPARVQAQPSDTPFAVSVLGGGGRTWDDEGSLGSGVAVGGRVEWRLIGNTRLEAGVDLLTHDRGSGFFQANGRTVLLTAAVVQRFGRGAAQPYVLAGGTLARHTGDVTFSGGAPQPRSSVDPGLVFGGGLVVRVKARFEVGPEFRVFTLAPEDDVDPAFAWLAGVRVGYRF